MSPFDRAHMTFYSRSIVSRVLSCVVSEIFNVEKRRDLEIWVRGQRSLNVIESGSIRKIWYGFLLVFHSNFVLKTYRFFADIRLVSIP